MSDFDPTQTSPHHRMMAIIHWTASDYGSTWTNLVSPTGRPDLIERYSSEMLLQAVLEGTLHTTCGAP